MKRPNILLASLIVTIASGFVSAQEPGDGVPDFYYFAKDGTVMTSFGPVMRTAGTMLVDSDDFDSVAMFIGGPDVSLPAAMPGEPGCFLCDEMNLPGDDGLGDVSTWTVGESAGSTQWIRSDPLSGRGFVGVIGTGFTNESNVDQPWPDDFLPFNDFPEADTGIAMYAPGLTDDDFTKTFTPMAESGPAFSRAVFAR